MKDLADLKDWNFQVLMLVQAMLGAITPNFRMVVLSRDEHGWLIKFYLEEDSEEDAEEVEDIVCQYAAYQDSCLKCNWVVLLGAGELPVPAQTDRVVYRRKEIFDQDASQ
ncbi:MULTISPECIES: hypothetical protein [unclassified Pseudomonas]|uniref:hypothetical protein n=1 Tax=unclassified Pseudomonas TaxID=196821 RepID=UPI000A1F4D91|nr:MULTISPECIES: hypothetical protein [unclassified Pseudomonas]